MIQNQDHREISFLYAIKQAKTIGRKLRCGKEEGTRKRRERETERERQRMKEIVSCCERILALVINLIIGQISQSLKMANPLEKTFT